VSYEPLNPPLFKLDINYFHQNYLFQFYRNFLLIKYTVMLSENYASFARELELFLPTQQIITDPIQTIAYGTDASFYRLNPQIVVEVKDEAEAIHVIALAHQHQQ